MAAHSSIFAWRIPWTEQLGRLQSIRSQKVERNWARTHLRLVQQRQDHCRWWLKKKKKIPRPWDSGGGTGDLNLLAVSSWPDSPTHQHLGNPAPCSFSKGSTGFKSPAPQLSTGETLLLPQLRSFAAHYCWLLASHLPGFALWLRMEKRSCGLLWAPPVPSPSTDLKNKGSGFCFLPLSYVVHDK